ncbi:Predicted arabinose efflux permease, MFS family [Pedobacter steynii]|uniref:Predicted arabinose efflux permease, MFS family n=1 Tax=Pedobacter steynii TaxID=430522 RepID=A0A1H0CSY3_9SPHI|nr:MFS transporter [Pedobacter steynii]NQX41658.1 MFS transporter [Pedobacter steynii]SDN60998.1 Predicted arabinose efflux permease, MFS family [Pedobacter steynii]
MSLLQTIAGNYKRSFSGLSRETWILSIVMLINRSGYMAVPFMGLYVTQSLHRSASDAGFIITLFGLGSILGSAAGGKLTDVIGFRPVQIFSAIIGGTFFLFFASITHFHTLCILAVVISFFAEAFRPANFAAIAAYAKPGLETRSYSLNRLATNIGWAFGVSMGGLIASYNYSLLFYVDGMVSIFAGLSILFFLPKIKAYRKTIKEKVKGIVVRKPWEDGLFIRFILLSMIFIICFFLMFRVVPVFFKESWKINEFMIGLILGLNGVIIALFEMVMVHRIEGKRSPVFFITVGVLFIAASFLVLMIPFGSPVLLGTLCIVFFTVGEMFALPFVNTFVMSRANEFNRGQYAAGYMLVWSVAQVVGPTAGFYIAEHHGYNVLWLILTALLLACAYLYKFMKTE